MSRELAESAAKVAVTGGLALIIYKQLKKKGFKPLLQLEEKLTELAEDMWEEREDD